MAITEKIGFEVDEAISNLIALESQIKNVNKQISLMNQGARGSKGLQNMANGYRNVASSANKAKTGVVGATSAMNRAGTVGAAAGSKLTLSWETFARVIATQLIVRGLNSIVEAMSQASEVAQEFEIATAKIANITDEGIEGIDGLRDSIRDLAISTGRDLEEATGAALEALQNDLGTTQETFYLLERSADDLAKATGTDLTSAVNSLSSVLKAYNADASESTDIADALFVAYDKGRISLEELESRLGTITPQAATLGVKFEEAAAAVASLTLSGLNSQTAMTQLRNVLAKMIKPTDELKNAFEKLGVESGTELIERFGGLRGALVALQEVFDGNEQAVARAFGTIRGQLGVLNLLANEGSNYNNVLEAMDDRLNRVREAANNVNETTTQKLREEFALLKDNLIPIGDSITQLKLDATSFINEFISDFQRLRQRQDFQALEQFAIQFGITFGKVIDDALDNLADFLQTVIGISKKAIQFIYSITDPVGARENQRLEAIQQNMERLQGIAAKTERTIRDSFAARGGIGITGDFGLAFEAMRNLEQQARITYANINTQIEANKIRILENAKAFDSFAESLRAGTAPELFGNPETQRRTREELFGISNALRDIIEQSLTAEGAARRQLEAELDLQGRKLGEKTKELGIDNKAIKALLGQFNATQQILRNQGQKVVNEEKLSTAALAANEALQAQKQIAEKVGVPLEQLGLSGDNAAKAIKNIPNPQVNAAVSISQMRQLEAAALEAARAIAAASGGGRGFYHGGLVYRASGGNIRGQDVIPAMLAQDEFVINARSSRRFFSQLQAMNSGQTPVFRDQGGPVTNIGDINVNVTASNTSIQTARQIATDLRRELRRKTSRFS